MYIHREAENVITKLLQNKKVLMLLGARQVGKTTLLEPFVQAASGTFLNCDIEVDKSRLLLASTLEPLEAMR